MHSRWLDHCPLGRKTQGWKSCYRLKDGRWPKTKDLHSWWPSSIQMLGSRSYPIPPRRYCYSWLPIILFLWRYFHLATSWRRTNPTPLRYWFRNRGSRMWKNPRIRSTITTTSDHNHVIRTMHVAPLGRITKFERWPCTIHFNSSKRGWSLRIDQTWASR